MSEPRPRRYEAHEVEYLRRRFAQLTAELNEVFDAIAAKVQAINEELDQRERPATSLAAGPSLRHDDRGAGG